MLRCSRYFVSPTRFELISSEPESEILSIELRRLRWQKYYFLHYFKIKMQNINADTFFSDDYRLNHPPNALPPLSLNRSHR